MSPDYAAISGQFGKPVLPAEMLTIAGYQAEKEKTVPFSVFNAQGQSILREGLLRIK